MFMGHMFIATHVDSDVGIMIQKHVESPPRKMAGRVFFFCCAVSQLTLEGNGTMVPQKDPILCGYYRIHVQR
jgi:hypothetical protein